MSLMNRAHAILRPLQLVNRVLQWCSTVIVLGLTSYFISKGPRGQHITYQEVIVCLATLHRSARN